jgi:hypothetical protein
MLSGVNATYPETIRPALETIGAHPKAGILSGMYMLVFEKRVVFCGDTTINVDPGAEALAQIALTAARIVRTFGQEPHVAMLSFSNFGSVRLPEADKVARAVRLVREADPSARGRRRDAGRHGARRAGCSASATRSAPCGGRPTVDLPQLERRQHRLQVTPPPGAAPRRSGPSWWA